MVADYGGRRLAVAIPTFISSAQYNAIVDFLGRFAINLTLLNPRNNPSPSVAIFEVMSDESVKDYRNLTGANVVIVAISSAVGTGMASKISAKALKRGFVVAQRLHGKRMHATAVDDMAANIPPLVPEPTWNLQG
ncbi:hypothetical protein Acr_28g0012690 [Actinidia rufa]|uniref:Uncharacterized protein n=1 Tax=Actinidia rufa TaxID=165716 RepID=A0A7J0HCX0_9ERIC|nr:hypothetical protein Acr_28g0012690 [Actinidia rufa]